MGKNKVLNRKTTWYLTHEMWRAREEGFRDSENKNGIHTEALYGIGSHIYGCIAQMLQKKTGSLR